MERPSYCGAALVCLRCTMAVASRAARPLNLSRRARGEKAGLILEPAQLRLHEIRTEVVEQQQPAQYEERADENGRHEADEDVGEDQFAPHAPQQAALGEHEQTEEEKREACGDRETRNGIDHAQKRRRGTEHEPHAPARPA